MKDLLLGKCQASFRRHEKTALVFAMVRAAIDAVKT
jgi:hypothetical protein